MTNKQEYKHQKLAWARFNAYGILLVGLLLLSFTAILDPEDSSIARATGEVPASLLFIEVGYIASGLCILWGFFRSLIWPEFIGLVLLNVSYVIQTVYLVDGTGWFSSDSIEAYIVGVIVAAVAALRCSVILTPRGWDIHIPGIKEHETGENDVDRAA